eukprot:TRINITY_DN25027_c0_g1_i1.p1 TRINITY_DN25027_c0_g1~~TRINITY_DN25027_c0_g1_i1.p1  ORF type:complete len:382 (-),score=71.27 TRINITY_DN25027_c0_g1_i1:59-1204(-)
MAEAQYEGYERIKLLGQGSFGKAYLAKSCLDGAMVVIKQVDIKNMKEEDRKATLKEAKILEALKHPNIVSFREVYKTKKGRLCIVMDYADGGDLSSRIQQARGHYFPEKQILDWFTQICLALKHVHDRKILHRDLKCQNIFLMKNNTVKLGDFGIARQLMRTLENARTMVGTPYYLSPELVANKPYGFKSDVWSLGVVLYELCALKPPFLAESLHHLCLKIAKGAYPDIPGTYTRDLRNLVRQMLQLDPNKRPTVNHILNMPLIRNRIRDFLSESIHADEFSHTILHKENLALGNARLNNIKNVINEMPMPQDQVKKEQIRLKAHAFLNQPPPVAPSPEYNNNKRPEPAGNKPPVAVVSPAQIVAANHQRPPSAELSLIHI